MDSSNKKQERNGKDRTVAKNDGSDDDDGNNSYYNANNPDLIKDISNNHSLLSSMMTESILNSLRERYNRRKDVLNHLLLEFVTNEEGTTNFYEAPGKLHTFHDENNNNKNDELKCDIKFVGFINELKAYVTQIRPFLGTLDSFEVYLMQSIQALEQNLKNLEEEETQEARRERRNYSGTRITYYPMPENITVYEVRKQAIEIVIGAVKEMNDVVEPYMFKCEEVSSFLGDNKNDEYHNDDKLEEWVDDELKELHDCITTVLGEVHTLEGKLLELVEILESNYDKTQTKKRWHDERKK